MQTTAMAMTPMMTTTTVTMTVGYKYDDNADYDGPTLQALNTPSTFFFCV